MTQEKIEIRQGHGLRQAEGEWENPPKDVASEPSPATSEGDIDKETHGGLLLEIRECDHVGG